MKKVGLIVATDPTGIIGIDGAIPWKYSEDMRQFKSNTMGSILIMGRKTFESMGCRQLPGRTTMVVTSTPMEGVLCFGSVEKALEAAQAERSENEIWVIGGSRLYHHVLERGLVDMASVTRVPAVTVPESAQHIALFDIGMLSTLRLKHTTESPDSPLKFEWYERP